MAELQIRKPEEHDKVAPSTITKPEPIRVRYMFKVEHFIDACFVLKYSTDGGRRWNRVQTTLTHGNYLMPTGDHPYIDRSTERLINKGKFWKENPDEFDEFLKNEKKKYDDAVKNVTDHKNRHKGYSVTI